MLLITNRNKMKKILLISFLGALFFSTASANSTILVELPSTFVLRVGESAGVKNYQNMEIDFQSATNDNGECQKGLTTPCPLGNPVNTANPKKAVVLHVTTPGGCGSSADSRCLGGPAFSQTFTLKEGSSEDILGIRIRVSGISENLATFSIAMQPLESDNDSDDTEIKPLPPVIKVTSVSSSQGTINRVDKIIICPNGESSDNCSVCSKGECRPETTPASPKKLGEPISNTNPPVFELKDDETLVSAVKVEGNASSTVGYEVKAKRKARLLFLLPVSPEIVYSINANGTASVSGRPWWNFLAW